MLQQLDVSQSAVWLQCWYGADQLLVICHHFDLVVTLSVATILAVCNNYYYYYYYYY